MGDRIDWAWNKGAYSTYADKVNFELMEIRSHLERLDAELQNVRGGRIPKDPWYAQYKEDISQPTTAEELVQATYAIRSAAIAMRGYLMLIDQMGLSRDQKKMIRELEYGMMMIMKAAQAIRVLQLASTALTAAEMGPMGFFYLAVAGGYAASALAYSSKIEGGMV